MKHGIIAALTAFTLISTATVAPVAKADATLVFGTYAPDKPSAMVRQLRPSLNRIAEHASRILGEKIEIKMEVVRSYEDGVNLIVNGDVDFARLGPASYVVAKNGNPQVAVLAMEKKNGAKRFNGIIAVHKDSDITSVGQLSGRTFAFGSERSTLGRYFSQQHLVKHGVYAKDLARFEYLGRHDKVGRAVGAGLFDAGALEETTFAKLVAQGVPIRAIARFSNATRPWVARAGLDPRYAYALRKALLELNDPDALKALRFEGFLEGDDTDYEPTRQAIAQNPLFFAQYRQ